MVNICFITKYPPIQGGVSMHCYWAARGLAERGHQVFVVTNADEVEETFRIGISDDDRAEDGNYQPQFPGSGGAVHVISTTPPDRRELYYIPMGNPTVTRLATIATDCIREHDCKVIFSYYLEPYGVAANLAARWTNVPYVFKHAGSDLHRLMKLQELRTGYTEVLLAANRVISRGPSRGLLLDVGVHEDRITGAAAFGLPRDFFNPSAIPLPLDTWLRNTGSKELVEDKLPVLGVYGKLGEYKGSGDLLHAMAALRAGGFCFHLLAASHGWQEPRYLQLVDHLGLTDYVHQIPFVPHWRIPSFIRSCTAVAFLERDFPIAAHTPTIPLEVIACGGCLVVSAEVARKQLFRSQIRDLRNIIVVPDPLRHDVLADRLRFALEDPARATEIGQRGHAELNYERSAVNYVSELEELLSDVAQETPSASVPRAVPGAASPRAPSDIVNAMSRFYPYTHALMTGDTAQRVRKSIAGRSIGRGAPDARSLGLELGRALQSILSREDLAIREVCRYECKALEWRPGRTSVPPRKAARGTSTWSASSETRPQVLGDFEVAHFGCDVEAIMEAIDRGDYQPNRAAIASETTVLLHEWSTPLRLSKATQWLVELVARDSPTIAEIESLVRDRYETSYPGHTDLIARQCMDALEGLFWEGVVALD